MKHLPLYNPQFENLYKEFSQMVKTKSYAGANHMATNIREFLFFIETRGVNTIREVKATDIFAYHEYLSERPNQRREGGLSDSSVRRHIYLLRIFFDNLLDTAQINATPARLPKFGIVKYQERNIATIEEIKQIYSEAKTMLEKAILGLAYGCGLRRSEIAKLNTSDIDFHKGMLTVRCGKLGKTRAVPISEKVLTDLKNYLFYERNIKLQETKIKINSAFLLSKRGYRIYAQDLNTIVKALVKKTKNPELQTKDITLHCLRHSIATHLLDNGASIEFVQKFLGHEMLDTTHIYSKRRKQKQIILEAVHREQQQNKNIKEE
ncbi:MAG: tyrosine-type recombinase/integrase [Bacteroidales bacterium]|jgi:site-specific recombinase XerD